MKYRREWTLDNATHVIVAGVALLFLAAGIIHLSAAADHRNLPFMMTGFVVVALAQIGLGALLFLRGPSRGLLLGGLLLMTGSLLVWLLSRTVGLPFLPGGHMEPIGFKDGVTVLFELAAVPGLFALQSPAVRAITLPTAQLGRQALTGLAAGIVLMFVPALVLGGGGHHSMSQMAAMSGHSHAAEGHHGGEAGHHAEGEQGHHDEGSGEHLHSADEPLGQTLSQPHHGDGGHGNGAGHGAAHGEHRTGADGPSPSDHGTSASHARHGDGGHAEHGGQGGEEGHGGHGDEDGHGGHGDGGMHHGDHDGEEGQGGHGGEEGHGGHGGEEGHGGHGDEDGHGGHGDGGMHHGDHDGEEGQGGHGGHGGDDGEGGHGGHGDHDGEEGHGGHGEDTDRSGPPVPGVATQRAAYIEPKPAGTRETIKLQYGPYPVPPGGDANQVNLEFFGAEGFIVGAQPDVRYADGTTLTHADRLHVHHAHLFRKEAGGDDQSDTRQGMEWVFGTGGETTSGSFERIADADQAVDDKYGIALQPEPMLFVWMPMNMSEETQTVFMEFEFEFVHGSAESIKKATGKSYHPLSPVMYGSTFNVPRTGGIYDWPLDARRKEVDPITGGKGDPESFGTSEPTQKANVRPGVGEIWTAPGDGVLVGSAGHQHAGGRGVVVSDLGSAERPCADDGDRFPGTTVLNSKTYYPDGVWPAHPLMGVSQPGWRLYVEKGDRIAINGIYDSRKYAWPDQMSILGFYWDENASGSDDQRCTARLADEPGATQAEAIASLPTQEAERGDDGSELFHTGYQPCVADGCNDYDAPPAPRGPQTTEVTIEDFTFTPGDLNRKSAVSGSTGTSYGAAPVVSRGDKLRFVNMDFVQFGGTRHAIASCHGPCNGPDVMSYPNTSGLFYSGPLGYSALAESASASNKAAPAWELDTSRLEPGYHTYYCWSHPWMRGAFYVEDMSDVSDDEGPAAEAPPALPSTPAPLAPPTPSPPLGQEGGPAAPDLGLGLPSGEKQHQLRIGLP